MTSNRNPLQDFVLTPQQQTLLVAALNSQQKTANGQSPGDGFTASPSLLNGSPNQVSMQESPLIDYDNELGGGADSSLDFSLDNSAKMIGDLPGGEIDSKSGSPDHEHPDKRSHPVDEDEENGEAKRRESEDRVAKKPGRKPLTTEPSTKRKAQNRAAQRAFRERKEKHLKDLETKVEELEKASESANYANKLLRAQVDRMAAELAGYKKRISVLANSRSTTAGPASSAPFGRPILSNINDVNFQFEFLNFDALPGLVNQSQKPSSGTATVSPPNRSNGSQLSPIEASKDVSSPSNLTNSTNSSTYSQVGLDAYTQEDLANFNSLFSPALTNGKYTNVSRTSIDSHNSAGGATTTSSPSTSSNSHLGATSSSCGTSPEPLSQSPMGFKPVDTLSTIGEEQPAPQSSSQDFGHFSAPDSNNFNWLPQHNFQFDPNLFGAYREPQENVLSNAFDDSFFNDALDVDFTQPYNLPPTVASGTNLIAQIDAAKNADIFGSKGQNRACNKIWEELQNCPKIQSGDFDLDSLCSELQQKAKCSGNGPVVNEQDFKTVMQKYLGSCEKNWNDLSKFSA